MKNVSSFLGLALLAASVPLAHAGLEINYSINGGTTVTCPIAANPDPSTSCANVAGTATSLGISGLEANSNAPGGPVSFDTSATSTLNNFINTASATIVINVISTDFTSPTAPPDLTFLSHISGTDPILGAGINSVSYLSCIDTANSQAGGCPTTDNAPLITPSLTLNPGSYEGDSSSTITTLAGHYAIDEQITVVLAAGSVFTFSASSTLIQATPEPMSIALLGGVLLFTTGAIRRKRKQASRV